MREYKFATDLIRYERTTRVPASDLRDRINRLKGAKESFKEGETPVNGILIDRALEISYRDLARSHGTDRRF